MILYNVTLNVDNDILQEWIQWMKETHLPEVMATGKFISYGFYKIQNHEPSDKSNNFSVQYLAMNLEDYQDYANKYGPALKKKTLDKYGDKVLAFRTLMESVD